MIPILFPSEAVTFTTNGIGRLTDCISCVVTEERNGIYECEFEYPITGIRYSEIQEGRLIVCTHDDRRDLQPFRIYRRSAPINGIVTFSAHHISYDLGNVILKPFTADNIGTAFTRFRTYSMTENDFTFWTDKSSSGSFSVDYPISIKEILGGMEGSILDAFGGGEYEWDKFTVKLYQNRGSSTGATIRYGKNLVDIEHEIDIGSMYNAVVPYWTNSDNSTVVYGGIVTGPRSTILDEPWTDENKAKFTDENGEIFYFDYSRELVVPLDLSSYYNETQPTVAQLEAKALSLMTSGKHYLPAENITVDFIQLWQTDEYDDVAVLQRFALCDKINVYFPALGVTAEDMEVIKVEYNVLLDKYDSMELGEARTSFADVVTGQVEEAVVPQTISRMQGAIDKATALITGAMGGHVVFQMDAYGKPQEILIMDTESTATAVNVLRININGIGFSSSGINGPYRTAWTLDGAFVADFITAGQLDAALITVGTMLADRIRGGTLVLGYQDGVTGSIEIYDADGVLIGSWDQNGIYLGAGDIEMPFYTRSEMEDGLLSINSTHGYELSYANFRQRTVLCGYTGYSNYPASGTILGQMENNFRDSSDMEWKSDISPCGLRFAKTQWNGSTGTLQIDGNFDVSGFGISEPINGHGIWYNFNSDRFSTTGTKSRVVNTEDYSDRLLYCYETPSPLFGDVGEGTIGEDGLCYVMIDSIFAETVTLTQYQVFLQKYGEGECWVKDRKGAYFVVQGTPGLGFGWELKARQSDFDQLRMEKQVDPVETGQTDYGALAAEYISDLKEGRLSA